MTAAKDPTRPAYPVITFGAGVEADAMSQVCQPLKDLADWYVNFTSEDYSASRIYEGSYGYGGKDVA